MKYRILDPEVEYVPTIDERIDHAGIGASDERKIARLIMRKNASKKTLEKYSKHKNYRIRKLVAAHALVPESAQVHLAKDPVESVRHTLAKNTEAMSEEALLILLKNGEDAIVNALWNRRWYTSGPFCLPGSVLDIVETHEAWLKKEKSVEHLRLMANDDTWTIRDHVADNPQ